MKTGKTATALLITLLLSLMLDLLAPVEVDASGIPDFRFGVVEAHHAPSAAASLGAGWTRVTFRWNELQPNGPQAWNAGPISDQALANETAQGREVVGLLVTTPGWATDLGIGPGVPRGLYLPTEDPNNLWAAFVRAMVGRYAGRIDHWIIWNEPDIPDTRHMSWGGSVEDFVRLLQVAYTVAKETNPSAVIHMAAVTHWWDQDWFGRFLAQVTATPNAAANNHYFDVATLHIYFQPETVHTITAHYRDMMRGYGMQKPIWIAETNAAPSHDPSWPVPNAQFDVSLEQQAAYVVQAFSLGIAAGAERIAVYKMVDTEADRQANPEPFGLVRADGSRRPAFIAYQVATTYLAGFRSGAWQRQDTISLVTIDRGDATTTVVWARGAAPETAVIPARATQALIVGALGGARTIYPERGYYYVDLPGATCTRGCQIGGPPLLLVEGAPMDAKTAPTPRPPTPTPLESTATEATPAAAATPTATRAAPEASGTETLSGSDEMPTPTSWVEGTLGVAPTDTPSPTATGMHDSSPSPSPTATRKPNPTATSSPTVAATRTTIPTPTASPAPRLTASPSPSPSKTPVPAETEARRRSWILIATLVAGLAAVPVVAFDGRP